jgi:hypothetical protein
MKRPPAHGTITRYRSSCRCKPCRGANAERSRANKARRRADGRPLRPSTRLADRVRSDMLAIAGVAAADDSEVALTRRLVEGPPSSSGPWHPVKVHRRVVRMRWELQRAGWRVPGLAGEVARVWGELALTGVATG